MHDFLLFGKRLVEIKQFPASLSFQKLSPANNKWLQNFTEQELFLQLSAIAQNGVMTPFFG